MFFSKTFIIFVLIFPSFLTPTFAVQEGIEEKDPYETYNDFRPAEETTFDRKLPETQKRKEIELSFNPQFTDAIDQKFIRNQTRAKYGLTKNLEMSFSLESFTDNPFQEEGDSGLSRMILGGKYKFPHWDRFPNTRISTGLETVFPIGSPPEGISDRYLHIKPFLVSSHFLRSLPHLEIFYNLNFDLTASPPFHAPPDQIQPHHLMGISIGGVYYWPIHFGNSVDFTYTSNEIDGGNENNVDFNYGIFWTIPKSFFGKWGLGAGIRVPLTSSDENFTFFTKFKWDINLKIKIPISNPKASKNHASQLPTGN